MQILGRSPFRERGDLLVVGGCRVSLAHVQRSVDEHPADDHKLQVRRFCAPPPPPLIPPPPRFHP